MEQVFFADPVGFTAHDIDETVLVLTLHLEALAFGAVLYDESEVRHLKHLVDVKAEIYQRRRGERLSLAECADDFVAACAQQ